MDKKRNKVKRYQEKRKKKKNINKDNKKIWGIIGIVLIVFLMIVCVFVFAKDRKGMADKQKSKDAQEQNLVIDGKEVKISDVKPEPIDETKLKRLIEEAKLIKVTEYTDKSVEELQTAISDAEKMLNDDFEQEMVEKSCGRIVDAIQKLEKK